MRHETGIVPGKSEASAAIASRQHLFINAGIDMPFLRPNSTAHMLTIEGLRHSRVIASLHIA